MAFVRTSFPSDPVRNGSIVKRLVQKFGQPDTEVMVQGAALLGWKDLRGLYAKEGIGRRWAQTAYWRSQDRKAPERLTSVAAALKARGF
jgi:hypothetical protein